MKISERSKQVGFEASKIGTTNQKKSVTSTIGLSQIFSVPEQQYGKVGLKSGDSRILYVSQLTWQEMSFKRTCQKTRLLLAWKPSGELSRIIVYHINISLCRRSAVYANAPFPRFNFSFCNEQYMRKT